MVKRISVLLFVIIFSFLVISINVEAENNNIESLIDESNRRFSIDDGREFNYLFVYSDDVLDICSKYNDVIKDYLVKNYCLKCKWKISNDIYLIINCNVINGVVDYIDYYVNDDLFLKLRCDEILINKCDLRKYNMSLSVNNVISYELISNINLSFSSKESIFNDFKFNIGIGYINGINIKSINRGNIYHKGEEATLSIIEKSNINSNTYSYKVDFDGERYDNLKAGRYVIIVYSYNFDGTLDIKRNVICVYDEDCLSIIEANIGYKTFVNQKNYINNYIEGPDDYFDKNEYIIVTEYFNKYNEIGSYEVYLEYVYDYTKIEAYGVINVIDNINPYFIGDDIVYGKTSEVLLDIKSIFSNVDAYDEIDGNLKDKIIFEDLDNYFDNIDKAGEYKFKLIVSDNSGNSISKIFKYIVIDETKEENNDSSEEVIEDSKPIIDNNEKVEETTTIATTKIETNNIIKGNVNDILNIDDIKRKLLFNGFISDDFNGEIITDYIGNEGNAGSYEVKVINNAKVKYYVLIIENNNIVSENKESGNIIIIIVSIFGGIVLVVVVVIVIRRKIKLNK